jgi:hypothetical protein
VGTSAAAIIIAFRIDETSTPIPKMKIGGEP